MRESRDLITLCEDVRSKINKAPGKGILRCGIVFALLVQLRRRFGVYGDSPSNGAEVDTLLERPNHPYPKPHSAMNIPRLLSGTIAVFSLVTVSQVAAGLTEGMTEGKVDLKSAGPLSFGPEGILFVGDTKAAAVVAIATGDAKAGDAKPLKVEGIGEKIASLLGTAADQILINDMAVNPASRSVYLSVSRGRGPDAAPVIIRVKAGGELEAVNLEKVKSSRVELPDAPADAVSGEGRRQSNPRTESITDIAFLEDRVIVAGLSNEEFASTLRDLRFPFVKAGGGTSVEIYHGAHGKFETRSPVRTFVPVIVGNEPSVLAAYTCTPLVHFPISQLKPGAKIKGKTIAELGNRNRPLDMISYQKDGKPFLLLANSSRGIMKIPTDKIVEIEGITEKVDDKKGLGYETIDAWKGIDQLDRLDDKTAVVLARAEGGALTLESRDLP
jgi:hypothetical protein